MRGDRCQSPSRAGWPWPSRLDPAAIMMGSVTFCETMSQFQDENEDRPSLEYIELYIVVFTTVRQARVGPSFKEFFSSYLNWIDVAQPFYVELAAAQLDPLARECCALCTVRVFRIRSAASLKSCRWCRPRWWTAGHARHDDVPAGAVDHHLQHARVLCRTGHHDRPAEAVVPDGGPCRRTTRGLGVLTCVLRLLPVHPARVLVCMVTLMTVGYGDANTVLCWARLWPPSPCWCRCSSWRCQSRYRQLHAARVDFKKRKTSSECGKKLAPVPRTTEV